jgi:hypothetical protein
MADVYAFGVLFNATMAGEAPYTGLGINSLLKLFGAVTAGTRPRIPDWIDENWRHLIGQCWHADADRRPSFQDIVALMSTTEFMGQQVDAARFLNYQKKIDPHL